MSKCEAVDCKKVVKKWRFCAIHKCKVAKCSKQRTQTKHCDNHIERCKLCAQPVVESKKYCTIHMCAVVGCEKNVSPKRGRYCVDHVCIVEKCIRASEHECHICSEHKCANPGCLAHRLDDAKFCAQHIICYICYSDRIFDDACSGIHPCDVCGVDATKKVKDRTRSVIVCDLHYSACIVLSCTKNAHGKSFCSDHKCVKICCDNYASNNFCDKHKCAVDDCVRSKYCDRRTANYCDKHMCSAYRCDCLRLPNERMCATHLNCARCSAFAYCHDHTDPLFEFPKFVVPPGRFCNRLLCPNKSINGEKLCADHYWQPRCLYCLSDDEQCTPNCIHKKYCELPCVDKRCCDIQFIRKNNRTTYDYYLLSRAKYIHDSMPSQIIYPIARLVAEYL